MFVPKTERLKILAKKFPERIFELEKIFEGSVNIYIDYANVRPWSEKLGWHVHLKRLKQFLDSFDNIRSIKIYKGSLPGDEHSEEEVRDIVRFGYDLKTKPVKKMKHSIDVSSISLSSPDLLKQFTRKCLLDKYTIENIEYLNARFKEMNGSGIYYIEDLKCNFDVEIGRDMLVDYYKSPVDTYVLWSGDSDFVDPIVQLLDDNKNVLLFATARKVSSELNALQYRKNDAVESDRSDKRGLFIFDIKKIKNFVCWPREMSV
jgi:uncharacterized LabA/DUF88 family protein